MRKFKIVKLADGDYAIKKRVLLFFYIWICWNKRVHFHRRNVINTSFEIKTFSVEKEAERMIDFLTANSILYRIKRFFM